jgi:hypothetical protein
MSFSITFLIILCQPYWPYRFLPSAR